MSSAVVESPELSPLVAVVTPYTPTLTETFIQRHIERLPTRVVHIHGWRPSIGNDPVLPFVHRLRHKLVRLATGRGLESELTAAYRRAIRRNRVRAVLAEYGEVGVVLTEACRLEQVPLVVHFHGYDASNEEVLTRMRDGYARMFSQATAIVAVSGPMLTRLLALGAPPEKTKLNPYGTDCNEFSGADPSRSSPVFLAVGRFVEKKAPELTLRAFALVVAREPAARLRMIGAGPLLEASRAIAAELGIAERVEFLGPSSHDSVRTAMRSARCFVQHSRVAANGESEGTPVSIIEAQASGLPVVATRHAGIPEVVLEGKTGFLVEEGDHEAMAERMYRLVANPELAGELGLAGRHRMLAHYSEEESLLRLWNIIRESIRISEGASPAPAAQTAAASPLPS